MGTPLRVPRQHDRFGGAGYKGNVVVFDPGEASPPATVVVADAPAVAEVTEVRSYAELRDLAKALDIPYVGVRKAELAIAVAEADAK